MCKEAEDVQTCPDQTATLKVDAKSNVPSITYVWNGDGDAGNTAVFETRKFTEGNSGDIYKYNLMVAAGKCVNFVFHKWMSDESNFFH